MIKSGTVIGSVSGKTLNDNKIKSGTVIGTAIKKVNEGPLVLPSIPVSNQIHLTDAQKQKAAVSRGYSSVQEETEYQKSNPNLYTATGGKKYMEEGYAALKNPDSVISPNRLTEDGKTVISAAKDADAGKTIYDDYTPEQIDKVISSKWHRSTNDEQTKKEVDYLKALKSVKEIGFKNLHEYNEVRSSPKIISEYKEKMDAAYKDYQNSKEFIGAKAVDRYIGGNSNTESIEETQKREAWEKAALQYYSILYPDRQSLEQRYELLQTATAPMTTAWQKQVALKKLGIKSETAIREEKEIGAALKKTRTFDNYSEYIGANLKAGGINLLTGVSATGEFIVGTPIKFMIDISGGDSSIISGKAARDALTEEYGRRAMEAAQAVGDDKNIGGQLLQNIVQNIPNIALAFMTAGGSEVVTLAEKAASLSGQAGKMAKIGLAIKTLAQNPLFWSSFSVTAGNDYEEALAAGANPMIATLYALTASGINAYIEIGGGIETLPKDLVGVKSGGEMLKEFITTSLEEGGEEILQGSVSKLFSKLMYDHSLGTLDDAARWAKENLYEGAMGVLGGAVMGGGQMTFSTIMNAKTVKQYKSIGEAAISSGQAENLIKYALGSDMYSELAQSTLNTNNAQSVGEIYSYICRDIDTAINGAKSIDEAVEGIKAIARQEGLNNDTYTVTKGIAMPQFIKKVSEFGINDEKTAGSVLDVILEVDKAQNDQTNAEISESAGAENAAGEVAEDGTSGSESEENIFTEPDKKEIFEDKISGKMLTITQQHIEETAKRLDPDITIKWVPDIKTNGQWNPHTKVLSLNSNLSTAEAYVEIFKHELLHSLERKANYNAFLNYLENDSITFVKYAKSILAQNDIEYTGGNAGAVKALFDYYYEMYTTDERIKPEVREKFTLEDAKREAAADFFADVLFKGKEYQAEMAKALRYGAELPSGNAETSLSALEELAQKDKNLFVRIWDAVKRFISNLKNHATNNSVVRDLEKLERKLQDVYNSAENKNTAEDIGEKHHIGVLKNGNTYVIASRRIITSTDLPTMRKQISGFFDALLEEKGSLDIPTINGDVLTITKKETANKARDNYKYENGKRIKMTNDEYAVKVRAESHIDELAETSKELPRQKGDNKNHPFAKNGFIYRIAYFEDFDGQYYQITLSVGKSGTVATIYNIGKIKEDKLPSAKLIAVVGSKPLGSVPSKHSIRQNSEKSQEKVSERDSEYLELAKEPEKNETKLRELVENAAKKAGYGIEGWHATKADRFTAFDKSRIRTGTTLAANMGDGFYFSENKTSTSIYGDRLYHSYLNLGNAFIFTSINDTNAIETINKYAESIGREKLSNLEQWKDADKRTGAMLSRAIGDGKGFSEYLSSLGYNSIVYNAYDYENNTSNMCYVVFEPNQIKSADPVTYDDNGNVIPLSERFNDINNDIRYSLRSGRLDELRYRPEMFAKWLLKQAGSKADVDTVTAKLKSIITAHNKGGSEAVVNSEGEYTKVSTVKAPIEELARYIANGIKTRITDDAQEVLRTIRQAKVYIDNQQLQEIKYKYGTLTNFRKATSLNVTPSASVSLDSQWQEWAEMYPQYFDADITSVDMPVEAERIINSLKDTREATDEDGAAEFISERINEVLENSGPKARQREIATAANTAAKEATAKERARGEAAFEEYRRKESERKYNEAVSKRKREYRNKAIKLRDKFTKALEKPKKNNHVPQQFIKRVVAALDIVYDNPIDYDDTQIGGKYFARLEKLNQDIQNTADEQTRAELKEQYDRLYRTATNAGDRVREIKQMLDALKNEDTYARVYNDPGDDKLFQQRTNIYDESISKMLGVLADELGETEAYNYNEHQLRIISEVFAALDKHISDYNKLIGVEERIEISEAANEFINEISKSHGNFKLFNSAILKQMSPLRFFRMLGNYESNSMAERIYDSLNAGENKKIGYIMKSEEMLKNEILGNPELFRETEKMFSTAKDDLVDSGLVDENEQPVMVTRGMRLSLAMHGLNEQNRKALINGGIEIPKNLKDYYKKGAAASKNDVIKANVPRTTDALGWYSKLNGSLSDIEKKWINTLENYYSEISAPALNEITMQVFGFKKASVRHYWRMVRTEHFLDKPIDTIVRDSMLEHAGYLEQRKNSSQPLYLMDAIDQLTQDIENHANYYGLVIPLANFNKIYNFANYDFDESKWQDSVKNTIDNKYSGGKATKYIESLISDLNGARHGEVSLIDKMRGNYAMAVLSLNPRVAVKQTASYPTAAAVLGWKPILKALAVVEKEGGKKNFVFARAELDEIAKYSPLLWYRMRGNMDVELGAIKETGNVGEKLAKKLPGLLGWINKMDAATVGRLWYASKYYVEDNFDIDKGTPQYYKKTAEIFEEVIEETQPNYSTMQRPDILRSTNALTRALTMFYTQRLQNANILFDSAMELKTKSEAYKNAMSDGKVTAKTELKEARTKFGRVVSSQAVSTITLNVMELAIRLLLSQTKPYRDKDTDEVTEAAIWQGLGNGILDTMFGTVLFGSEVYEAINAVVSGGKFYGLQVPAVEEINDAVNTIIKDGDFVSSAFEKIKKGSFEIGDFAEELTTRTLESLIGIVQPLMGIPIKNAKDMISGIVHSAIDALSDDLFEYEASVADNAYNRIVGAKARSNTQNYRILANAILSDDKDEYKKQLDRLLKSGYSDNNLFSGLRTALKNSNIVKSESDKIVSKVKDKKVYKNLSDERKKAIQNETRRIIAEEKMLSVKQKRSKDFKKLYELSRLKDKSGYNVLFEELKNDGFSEKEIEIGLEVEKFKLLESEGISIAEWFTAKQALSEQNAKKNAEKYLAIQKMDFSAKEKEALWQYNK